MHVRRVEIPKSQLAEFARLFLQLPGFTEGTGRAADPGAPRNLGEVVEHLLRVDSSPCDVRSSAPSAAEVPKRPGADGLRVSMDLGDSGPAPSWRAALRRLREPGFLLRWLLGSGHGDRAFGDRDFTVDQRPLPLLRVVSRLRRQVRTRLFAGDPAENRNMGRPVAQVPTESLRVGVLHTPSDRQARRPLLDFRLVSNLVGICEEFNSEDASPTRWVSLGLLASREEPNLDSLRVLSHALEHGIIEDDAGLYDVVSGSQFLMPPASLTESDLINNLKNMESAVERYLHVGLGFGSYRALAQEASPVADFEINKVWPMNVFMSFDSELGLGDFDAVTVRLHFAFKEWKRAELRRLQVAALKEALDAPVSVALGLKLMREGAERIFERALDQALHSLRRSRHRTWFPFSRQVDAERGKLAYSTQVPVAARLGDLVRSELALDRHDWSRFFKAHLPGTPDIRDVLAYFVSGGQRPGWLEVSADTDLGHLVNVSPNCALFSVASRTLACAREREDDSLSLLFGSLENSLRQVQDDFDARATAGPSDDTPRPTGRRMSQTT